VLCCDLDGVLFEYEGFKGHDVFGKPIPGASETLRRLHREGWYIVVFTTRPLTPALRRELRRHRIPFDDVNLGKERLRWAHNPPKASAKPYADAYIDDRDWRSLGRRFDRSTWRAIYKKLAGWKRRKLDRPDHKH
jgi:hypothetical protein